MPQPCLSIGSADHQSGENPSGGPTPRWPATKESTAQTLDEFPVRNSTSSGLGSKLRKTSTVAVRLALMPAGPYAVMVISNVRSPVWPYVWANCGLVERFGADPSPKSTL